MSAIAAEVATGSLRTEQVADKYGWTPAHVLELARRGAIPNRKLAGHRRVIFPVSWLILWEDGAELETLRFASGGRVTRPVESSPEMREPGPSRAQGSRGVADADPSAG